MAPAGCCCCYCCWGGAVAAGLLLLLGILSAGLCPGAVATEHYSPLSLLKQELQHRQQQEAPAGGGCSPQSGDWGDQYSVECGESSFLNFHDSDCEPKGPPPCDSLLSLNTEKILVENMGVRLFISSLILQIFILHLLCARRCAKARPSLLQNKRDSRLLRITTAQTKS